MKTSGLIQDIRTDANSDFIDLRPYSKRQRLAKVVTRTRSKLSTRIKHAVPSQTQTKVSTDYVFPAKAVKREELRDVLQRFKQPLE